jgi:toxin YoeB
MYKIIYDQEAIKQLSKLQNNQKYLTKLALIIAGIKENPYSPFFKFERLKGNLAGYCSKRVTQADRVVYRVIDNVIEVRIKSVHRHYSDR